MTLNLTVPDASGLDKSGWTQHIADAWNASREAVIHVGSLLIEAKTALPHGEFEAMVDGDLPFSSSTARRLMIIAADGRLVNRAHGHALPPSWRTLYEITKLDDETFNRAIEAGDITPDMARADVRRLRAPADAAGTVAFDAAACAIEDLEALAASGKARFGAILADPPWTFETYSAKGKGRSAERHYPCMTDAEIAALPIKELAADDCVLFLWTTWAKLEDALWILEKWGFDYKTVAFTWVKQNRTKGGMWMGMGLWTRSNPEPCLLATRGAPKRLAAATDVRELIVAPVREHSRKPDEARQRIGRLVGGPYLELFARSHAEGWDAWGAEVGKFADPPVEAGDDAPTSKKPVEARRQAPTKASAKARGKVSARSPAKSPAIAPAIAPAKVAASTKPSRPPKPSPDVARIRAEQKEGGC